MRMPKHDFENSPFEATPREKKIEKINKKDLTIFSALDQIVDVVENEQIKLQCLDKIKTTVSFLTKKLDITSIQAMLFAPIANLSPNVVSNAALADFFNCTNIHVMRYSTELDALVEKKLLRYVKGSNNEGYCVPKNVMAAFKDNKMYLADEYKDYTTEKIFDVCDEMFADVCNDDMAWEDYILELRSMLQANKSLKFAKKIQEYNLADDSFAVLMMFCLYYIYCGNRYLETSRINFMRRRDNCRHINALRMGNHVLQTLNLVENVNNEGLADTNIFKLTDFAKNELLSEVVQKITPEKNNQLLSADAIVEKKMFYNSAEDRQIKQLYSVLEKNRFAEVQNRLKDCGMRTGFACLFYGEPGTGKTETVLQLARQTGRSVMQVNISEIKSKWVGESEKNIKEIFNRYRSLVKEEALAPILFFNEADAIFGTRMEHTQRAVDKMENSIQNIILQEMENLNGILIATTNLSNNLDRAFERRFLYKIKFQKPNIEAKKSIWKSMMPEVDEELLDMLATKYDFSGGQIENIARKKTIKNIIDGEQVTFPQLVEFCDAEILDKCERKVVGFKN